MILTHKSIGFGKTLCSNTGSTPLSFVPFASRLDWLQGSVKLSQSAFEHVLGETSNIFKDTFAPDKGYWFSGRAFDHHRVSDRGGRVAWNVLENGDHDLWLMIPAKLLAGCDRVSLLMRFLSTLKAVGFKPTRIDLAIDDYTKSISWQQFDTAYDSGDAHGFRECGLSTSKKDRNNNGFTFYMGSKRSEKLYRFYDKDIESNGEIEAYRLEVQFRDEWSKSVWAKLLAPKNEKDFHQSIVDCVCTPIDFYVETIDDTNLVTRTPLSWWSDYKNLVRANGITLSCGRVKTSIEAAMDWVENQVETTLAMIENYLDKTSGSFYDWLMARIKNGRERLKALHLNKVESAYMNWLPPIDIYF